jgi:uncharacterized metal-binding protein
MNKNNSLPLIYSCSGCSNIAQLANQTAVELNRERKAEMSCIAGIGGDVKPLVKKAQSASRIIALDGCSLHCVKNTLARHSIIATWHFTLTDFDIKKRYHADFSNDDLLRIKENVLSTIQSSSDRASL